MPRLSLAFLLCIAALPLLAQEPKEQAKDVKEAKEKVLKSLQGKWTVEKHVDRGEDLTKAFARLVVTVKDNTFKSGDKPKDSFTVELDPTQTPPTFDIIDGEKTQLGIYELKVDTLTFCVADAGAPRPKELSSTKESKTVLTVLKRPAK